MRGVGRLEDTTGRPVGRVGDGMGRRVTFVGRLEGIFVGRLVGFIVGDLDLKGVGAGATLRNAICGITSNSAQTPACSVTVMIINTTVFRV